MSGKLLWSGLTIILALPLVGINFAEIGAIVMIAGAILLILDK